jgi:hypothetical protein
MGPAPALANSFAPREVVELHAEEPLYVHGQQISIAYRCDDKREQATL